MFPKKLFGVLLVFIVLVTMCSVFAVEDSFTKSCDPLDYKQVEKNSAKFMGDHVQVNGTVFQIMEDPDGYGLILMHVDDDYGQIMAVMYEGSNDILEDDYITVYGNMTIDYSYESQAGYQLSVPCMLAESKYIEEIE